MGDSVKLYIDIGALNGYLEVIKGEHDACMGRAAGSLALTSKGQGVEGLLDVANTKIDLLNAAVTQLIARTHAALTATGQGFEVMDEQNRDEFANGDFTSGAAPVPTTSAPADPLYTNQQVVGDYISDKYKNTKSENVGFLDKLDDALNLIGASVPWLQPLYYMHTAGREELNAGVPETEPCEYKDGKKVPIDGWQEFEDKDEVFHNQSKGGIEGGGNEKYSSMVDDTSSIEGVYDRDGNLVTDPLNKGTYNYVDPNVSVLGHAKYDVIPYILWGNGVDDPSNILDRIKAVF
ncbi:MAG: hypothetical protein LBR44_11265 [Clostridiales Family XIII bacterium]|jgi:hypothetical protein|nr:hypothetical protein [Clostridiales Family XIII bacterium]